jgi:hypothetical protein
MDQPVSAPPSLAQAIFVGILAGLATALLSGLLTPGVAPIVFLSLVAPAPLFIAGFGWHPLVAALGGIVAALVAHLLVGMPAALAITAMLALPAFVLTTLAERLFSTYAGRPERDGIDLGRMAVTLVLYIAIVGIASVMVFEPDFDALQARIRAAVEAAFVLMGMVRSGNTGTAELASFFDMLAGLMLPMSALLAMLTVIISGTLGLMITDRSGRLGFARPDFRRFRLPGGALILIGVAFLVGIRSGYVGMLGEIVALGLSLTFMLQGLAVVHARTLGMNGRGLILAGVWGTLIVFGFPALIFILVGMADHLFDFRRGRL